MEHMQACNAAVEPAPAKIPKTSSRFKTWVRTVGDNMSRQADNKRGLLKHMRMPAAPTPADPEPIDATNTEVSTDMTPPGKVC